MAQRLRSIAQIIDPPEVAEGMGARVRRVIGTKMLKNLDPFLMLDHASATKPAGFPDHPHRGFETVSYMLEGIFKHEDFKGNFGELRAGDVQWMTAGRGIMHSEMPESEHTEGLQLWVNLRAADKMCEPAYQELKREAIPEVEENGVWAKIIAGKALGRTAETKTRTPCYYVDYKLQPGASVLQEVPENWNSFVYIIQGTIKIGDNEVPTHNAAILSSEGNAVELSSDAGSHFVFIAGEPLNEPIVQHGPFVMNSLAEIQQAFLDFQMGRNGFENAAQWRSTIGNLE